MPAFLNTRPGPRLTRTDVVQRMRAFWEEIRFEFPDRDLQIECLKIFELEKSLGTEIPAIVGAIRQFVEEETDLRRIARDETNRAEREKKRLRLEQLFLSGADCGLTNIEGSKPFYRRMNGRAFRIEQDKDKRWTLFRIDGLEDVGTQLGAYQGCRNANTALKSISYAEECR